MTTSSANRSRTAASLSGVGVERTEFGARVVDDSAGEVAGLLVAQRRVVFLTPEVREVEVVDDLGDQVVEALLQLDIGGAISNHAKRFQYASAELVRGGDGGRIEVGQRVA